MFQTNRDKIRIFYITLVANNVNDLWKALLCNNAFFNTRADRYWDNFFSEFIKPSVEKLGYTCTRSNADPGNIMKAIVNELVNGDVVLAVLTDYNTNGWYELGTRHSLKHGTIIRVLGYRGFFRYLRNILSRKSESGTSCFNTM